MRLLAVCVGTALVCGLAAAMVAPEVLIGGETRVRAAPAAEAAGAEAAPAPGLLHLEDHVRLDPREVRFNNHRWTALPEKARRAYLERYWRLAELDEPERDALFQQYREFRDAPKATRDRLRRRAKALAAFVETLSPQDQAVLESLPPEERAAKLIELWQARRDAW